MLIKCLIFVIDITWLHTFRAFQGLSINEFSGLQFEHQNSFDIQTGEQVWEENIFL